jgi:urate oxidase
VTTEISYGKAAVSTYRTYGTPLEGVTPIPESPFSGRSNVLLAAEIDVEVLGDVFLPAYTEGDNSLVVATDTMKNFIHTESLAFTGPTLEAWLYFLGRRFLETYPQMERLRLDGRELAFQPAVVPDGDGGFTESDVLFVHDRNDHGVASIGLSRGDGPDGAVITTDLESGRVGLRLMKVTGSAFKSFARDAYTTLPERRDRPLYTWLDVRWRYRDPAVATEPRVADYVASEQVADLAAAVFHRFVSLSIQHLIHEIGNAILDRFPQLGEVSFVSQNRLWDTSVVSEGSDRKEKVYTDPRPPFGRITLTLRRD